MGTTHYLLVWLIVILLAKNFIVIYKTMVQWNKNTGDVFGYDWENDWIMMTI